MGNGGKELRLHAVCVLSFVEGDCQIAGALAHEHVKRFGLSLACRVQLDVIQCHANLRGQDLYQPNLIGRWRVRTVIKEGHAAEYPIMAAQGGDQPGSDSFTLEYL